MATDKTVMAVIRAARPTFRNKYDKIAFAVHASFHASGYVLTATGPHALSDTALSNPSTDEVAVDHWNELDDEYAFVYANPENRSKKVLLKCLVMNDKLLVDALCEGSSEALHLEINVEDYAGDNGSNNYSDQYKNLDKFVKGLDKDILSKLESSSKSASSSRNPSSSETSDRSRSGIHEPSVGSGDYSSRIIHPSGILYPPVNPVGGSDLYPGPPAGVFPTRSDPSIGGGMHVGPNDPRWFGGIGGEPGFSGGGQPGVPPGARFDPFGPPGVPGFEPGRFTRNPRRPGHGTHPDLEHFRRDSDSDFI